VLFQIGLNTATVSCVGANDGDKDITLLDAGTPSLRITLRRVDELTSCEIESIVSNVACEYEGRFSPIVVLGPCTRAARDEID
jgi:hypothetical protein